MSDRQQMLEWNARPASQHTNSKTLMRWRRPRLTRAAHVTIAALVAAALTIAASLIIAALVDDDLLALTLSVLFGVLAGIAATIYDAEVISR